MSEVFYCEECAEVADEAWTCQECGVYFCTEAHMEQHAGRDHDE